MVNIVGIIRSMGFLALFEPTGMAIWFVLAIEALVVIVWAVGHILQIRARTKEANASNTDSKGCHCPHRD